ncbi:hypothetical protein EGJ92_32245, partial [Pseudomonas aeruginosa]
SVILSLSYPLSSPPRPALAGPPPAPPRAAPPPPPPPPPRFRNSFPARARGRSACRRSSPRSPRR